MGKEIEIIRNVLKSQILIILLKQQHYIDSKFSTITLDKTVPIAEPCLN